MSDFENSLDASFSLSDEGGSSGNATDSEGGEIFDKDMKEMLSRMKTFIFICTNLKETFQLVQMNPTFGRQRKSWEP